MATLNVIYKIAADISGLQSGVERAAQATEKMRDGLQSLKDEIASAFTVTALVEFGKQVLDAGDQIQKMADQTGIGIDQVQKLQYIAGQSGSAIESLVGAVQNLQQRLGSENSGAAGAMAQLGIEMDTFNKMNGYDQLTLLGGAIKDIQDPTEQASVAAALFGKTWKEILPAIKSGMKETGDQATIMSDQTVKGLDRIGDTMKGAHQAAIAWGGTIVLAIEKAGFAVGDFLSKFDPSHFGVTNTQVLKLAAAVNDPDGLQGALSKVVPKALEVGAALGSVALKAADAAEVSSQLTRQGNESIKMHEAAAKAAEAHAAAEQKFKDSVDGISFKTFIADTSKLQAQIPDLSKHIEEMAAKFAIARDQMNDLESADISYNSAALETDAGVRKLVTAFSTLPNVVPQGTKAIKDATDQVKSLGESIGDNLIDALSKVPDLMIKAFTGGGGLSGAFKAIGTLLAKSIVDPIIAGLSKAQQVAISAGSALGGGLAGAAGLGTTASAAIAVGTGIAGAAVAASSFGVAMAGAGVAGTVALGAVTLGIGAAAIGVALLIKHFTGLSDSVKQARADVTKFQDAMGGVQGTIDTVGKAFAQLGLSGDQAQAALKALWDTNAGAAAVDNAIADITDKLQRADVVSGILNGDFKDLLTQGVAMGVTLPTALQATIQQLVDMGVITGDNAKLFAQLSNQTGMDFTKMQELASKYGIQLSDLGPAFQQAHLTDIATSVINDFDTLAKGGANVDAVLAGMKKPINDIVNESIKFGTEIPANMKPWIEQLLKTGQLVDENGDKIDDISGIKFGPVIADQFQIIIDKISALIDVLTKNLPNAINNIPAPAPVHVPISYDDPGRPNGEVHIQIVYDDPGRSAEFAATGGLVTATGIQHFAAGGNVRPFRPMGSDTVPAMLTPGEMVLTRNQQKAVFSGGGGGSVVIQNSFSIAADVDSPAARERLRSVVDRATMQALRRQKRLNVA